MWDWEINSYLTAKDQGHRPTSLEDEERLPGICFTATAQTFKNAGILGPTGQRRRQPG
jgi:hypothetical protein